LRAQRRTLEAERVRLAAERDDWESLQSRLDAIAERCDMVRGNLDTLDYQGKRDLLYAFNVKVKIWATDHSPRFEATMQPEGVLVFGTSNLDHVGERQPDRLQRQPHVFERLSRLRGKVADADDLIVGIERDLTRDVDRMAPSHLYHLGVPVRARHRPGAGKSSGRRPITHG
jgi:hypothetical protein